MTTEKPARRTSGKRGSIGKAGEVSAPESTRPSEREHRFVDVDPWALLAEQFAELPEERAPTERERPKRK